jgi:sec-independent protein translocase protein TatA
MFPSGMEWIIVALLILLLFGAKKIPELARGIGQGIGEFKKASSEIRREIEKGEREDQQEAKVNRPKEESEKKEATNN